MLSLTRRQFGMGTAAITAASIAPPLAAKPASMPTAVTPAFAKLGDAWKRTWIAYFDAAYRQDVARIYGSEDDYEQEQQSFLSVRATLWDLQKTIFLKPANSYGDVVLKHHVFDEHHHAGTGMGMTDLEPGGYYDWWCQLEHEANWFDVPIDLNSAFAAIDGVKDRTKPEWQVIARWTDYRTPL